MALAFTVWTTALVSFGAEILSVHEQAIVPKEEFTLNLTEAEEEWIKAHPEVRWGADPHWPPFSNINAAGELEGIDVDLTRLVAERVGLRLALVRADSWSEVFEKAKAGDVDFLSATAKTRERIESFVFSNEYGGFPVVVVTRDNAPFIKPLKDGEGISVSVQRDSVVTDFLIPRFPKANFIKTDNAEESLRLVSQGKADVTVVNLAVATRVVRLNGLTNLKISGVTKYEFPLRFAVRKDEPQLVSILNKGLATITPDELENIYAGHLVPDIAKARDWGIWRRRALYNLLIGVPILAAIIFWNAYLLHQIRRRKKAEAALLEARDGLEKRTQELGARVAEVERLNRDLQRVNRDLESFSSAASHDLRAPVRRTSMFADMVASEEENSLTDESREWLGVIVEEARRMDQLITDLLAFARLGRAELHKEPVDMTHLVNETIEGFRPQLENREVVWSIGNLGKADCDPDLLHHALANLIDNALKYSRRSPQTHITVDRTPEASRNGEQVFYVQDNGCGFDMKEAGTLFTPFHRLQSGDDFEGTGIGLANVKKIIDKHGGRIWCESQPNKGSTFYFSLPTVKS